MNPKLIFLTFIVVGCGTLVGNPKKPGDNKPASIVIPEIEFELPSAVTAEGEGIGLVNTAANKLTIVHSWSYRTEKLLQQINKLFKRLNDDGVSGKGAFKSKGPDSGISGAISESSESDFEYQAVICYKDKPFVHARWTTDGSHILVTRDFSTSPFKNEKKSTFASEIELIVKENSTQINIASEGERKKPKFETADGSMMSEYITMTHSEDNISISGINDWYSDLPENGDFAGDNYVVAKLDTSGEGSYIGYRKSILRCGSGFDEDSADLFTGKKTGEPGFCIGRTIGAIKDFSAAELNAAIPDFEEIGVIKTEKLKRIELDDDLSCD